MSATVAYLQHYLWQQYQNDKREGVQRQPWVTRPNSDYH